MLVEEHIYDYPRRFSLPLELLSATLVALTTLNFGRAVLSFLLNEHHLHNLVRQQKPWLRDIITWLQDSGSSVSSLTGLVAPLLWLLLALLITQLVRNMFPSVRISHRGILVRWSGDWVPVDWEGLRLLRITESAHGSKFVVLLQTDRHQLTGWHRFYSLIYGLSWRRGMLITSGIQHGEVLIKSLINERARLATVGRTSRLTVDDSHTSPLFRLLLGVHSARPRPTTSPAVEESLPFVLPDRVVAEYKPWLSTALFSTAILLAGLALWQYVRAWITFAYYQFPHIRTTTLEHLAQGGVVSPLGMLLGAHAALLAVAVVVGLLYHLFPNVAADGSGITLTTFGRTRRVSWRDVRVVKATTLSPNKHVVLIESLGSALPWWYRIGPLAYEGGFGRGGLVWPMALNFEALMQRIALELTRQPHVGDDDPRLLDNATGWLLRLATRPADALDELVLAQDNAQLPDDAPAPLNRLQLWQALPKMLWIGLFPALLLLAYRVTVSGNFSGALVPLLLLLTLWSIAEWPLVSLIAKALDEMVGSGTKEYQGLYLYPTVQLPRLLPLAVALLLTLLGYPTLALYAWTAGIAWSAVLTAGLWEALYSWRGRSLIAGSLVGVLFQLLTLIGVVLIR